MSKSCTWRESYVEKLSYKNLIGKIIGKTYAYRRNMLRSYYLKSYAKKSSHNYMKRLNYTHKL